MHIVIAQRRISVFTALTATLLLILLSSFLVINQFAKAAPAQPTIDMSKRVQCMSKDGTAFTMRHSPIDYTNNMCLGYSDNGAQYFQFAVVLPGAIRDASITAKNGSGVSIPFANTGDDTLFVSIPSGGTGMGYKTTTTQLAGTCDRSLTDNNITITAKGGGKTATAIKINLCDNADEKNSLIYNNTDTLVADGGQTTEFGKIRGNLGVARDGPGAPTGEKALLQHLGVDKIELTLIASAPGTKILPPGTVILSGDRNSSGTLYGLTDGLLSIDNIPPGTYTLKITYNDKIVADSSNPPVIQDWANENIAITFPPIIVPANGTVWISNPDGKTVQYYDGKGNKVAINNAISTDKPTTCAIDGIGWIICPVMNFMARIVDGAYSVVSSLLTTPNINTNSSDPTNGTYKAWEVMRTIANVAFVIAFLIIIFSQLTSVGITNYGIKKMLPRLIIAAILVNVSYFICAVAVDASNILGSSVKQVFDSVGGQLTVPSITTTNVVQTGNGWTGLVVALLAGGALLYAGLSVVLPALITALVAIVTVFLVLTLRQALILILIVVSPLAFVAFLLPNTEDLFNKWRKLLTTLLLMFPIIAGIFGASALASTVIMNSSTQFAVRVMGALVAVIPLFITPIVMKSAGGLLNKFGGMVNNPNKGPFDRMRKSAGGYRENRQEYRKLKSMNGYRSLPGTGRLAKQKSARDAVLNNRKAELNRSNADYLSARTGDDTTAGEKFLAAALNVKLKLSAEEIDNEVKRIIETGDPVTMRADVKTAFISATNSGDTIKALAAQRILATKLGAPGVQDLQNAINDIEVRGGGNTETIKELKRSSGEYALKGKDNTTAVWGYSDKSIAEIRADVKTFSGLNSVELANQNLDSLENSFSNISKSQADELLANNNATQSLDAQKLKFFKSIQANNPYIRPKP
jgi:hypothetical protein